MLARYFPAFLEFFFPEAYAGIDWTRDYTLLDKELQKVVRDASLGKRWADQWVGITGRDGVADWVLVHVEVQGEGHDHRSGQNAKFSGAFRLQPVVLYLLRYREPDRMAETMIMASFTEKEMFRSTRS